jgi:hypothetical protein
VGSRPNFANFSSMCLRASGYSTIGRPVSMPRQAFVRSSEVGPRPPVVTTRSAREAASRRAPMMRSLLSPTVVWRYMLTPRAASLWLIQAVFVSTRSPSSISVPMVTISALFMSLRPLCIGLFYNPPDGRP